VSIRMAISSTTDSECLSVVAAVIGSAVVPAVPVYSHPPPGLLRAYADARLCTSSSPSETRFLGT
jgi:hypothetical protein